MCYATKFEKIVTRSSDSLEGSLVTQSWNLTYSFLIPKVFRWDHNADVTPDIFE